MSHPVETFAVVAAPHPFSDERLRGRFACGTTLSDVLAELQPDARLRRHAVIAVNGTHIGSDRWNTFCPAAGDRVAVVVLPPEGGNSGGIILQTLLAAVVIIAGIATQNYWLVGMGVLQLAGAGYSAYQAATAPAIATLSSEPAPKSGTLAVTAIRNRAKPWGAVPRILGKHRAVPPYAALPVTEIVGGDKWLRVIFALSYGPVVMETPKIGETDLSAFTGIETEFRRGYLPETLIDRGSWDASQGVFPSVPQFGETWTISVGGTLDAVIYLPGETITYNGLAPSYSSTAWDKDQLKPFSLYPADIHQEDLSQQLTEEAGWITRTTQTDADELSIDITFPRGLLKVAVPSNDKRAFTVEIEIRYAPTGTTDWLSLGVFPIIGRQQDPLYWGHRWRVERAAAPNGQFDVSVRRITPANPTQDDEIIGDSYWTSLRTITNEDPVSFSGLAMLAMRVKPTEIANGTLDEFSCILTSIANSYESGSWAWRPTRNPAALYRSIFQVAPNKTLSDDQIDITRLEDWAEICASKGFVFNAYVDWELSRKQAANLICAAGRAVPSVRNGLKRSVVIDQPKTDIVQVFSPRNSWGYSGQIRFPQLPHGYLIAFANENANYKPDERIVYADGYGEGTATEIERLDVLGITDPDLAWKQGRFVWAERKRRRHSHVWFADIEALVCEPFDLVSLATDTISVGLGAGRIKALTVEGETITAIMLDIRVTMDAGKSYALQVRNAENGVLTVPLATNVGETNLLTLATPIPESTGPAVGDLALFGEAGAEKIDLLIQSIEPQHDLTARITAVPAAPEIHNADTGPLPEWQSGLKSLSLPAPTVIEIRSDATVMLVGPSGVLQTRVVFVLQSLQSLPELGITVLQRINGTQASWKVAAIESQSPTLVAILGVEDGESYDFQIQYTHPGRAASPSTVIPGYQVVGRLGLPSPLTDFSIAAAGNSALLRWAPIKETDVRFGGTIAFRHSPLMTGASWGDSVSIGSAAKGNDDHAWLPLKPGTYLARVFDAGGRAAAEVNTATTKQASLLDYVTVDSLQEDPHFGGTHIGTEVVDGKLQLKETGGIDDIADWDAIDDFDSVGQSMATSGTYRFSAGIDLGAVTKVRLTSHLRATIVNLYDLIDDRTQPIDSWPDMDGVDGAPGDAVLWAKLTDDDPAGTPTWSEFVRIDAQEVETRAIGEIECRLTMRDSSYQIQVSELRLFADALS
ncbi:MAG: MoaD/ThiS family protein [Hyphomicrobiales bacterium]|nr:MoaD/ThiS family protein [Hyphomicrobiales bacterium]